MPKAERITVGELCESLDWLVGQIDAIKEVFCCLGEDVVIECPPNLVDPGVAEGPLGGSRKLAGMCPTPILVAARTAARRKTSRKKVSREAAPRTSRAKIARKKPARRKKTAGRKR